MVDFYNTNKNFQDGDWRIWPACSHVAVFSGKKAVTINLILFLDTEHDSFCGAKTLDISKK
jgi:hypothetical protein